MALTAGDKVPSFALSDQKGKVHGPKDYAGQWLLIYFYPKDDMPGCTKEACGIRDAWSDFRKRNVAVLGVSTDSVKSHAKFAEKFGLSFPLLADEKKEMVNAFGVWGKKKFMGREYMGTKRWSFLVDPEGVIRKIYEDVKPPEHAVEILQDVDSMAKGT